MTDQTIRGYALFVKVETVRFPLLTDDEAKAKEIADDVGAERMVALALTSYGQRIEQSRWAFAGLERAPDGTEVDTDG